MPFIKFLLLRNHKCGNLDPDKGFKVVPLGTRGGERWNISVKEAYYLILNIINKLSPPQESAKSPILTCVEAKDLVTYLIEKGGKKI